MSRIGKLLGLLGATFVYAAIALTVSDAKGQICGAEACTLEAVSLTSSGTFGSGCATERRNRHRRSEQVSR